MGQNRSIFHLQWEGTALPANELSLNIVLYVRHNTIPYVRTHTHTHTPMGQAPHHTGWLVELGSVGGGGWSSRWARVPW